MSEEQLFEDSEISTAQSSEESKDKSSSRKRSKKPFPNASFENALNFATQLNIFASGERARMETFLNSLGKTLSSGATREWITNANKYGLIEHGYSAEFAILTKDGLIASSPDASKYEKTKAYFQLSIVNVAPFNTIYESFKKKRVPAHEVLKDHLKSEGYDDADVKNLVDLFIVNAKFIGLLQTINNAETIISIEALLDDLGRVSDNVISTALSVPAIGKKDKPVLSSVTTSGIGIEWEKICFYITPIGDSGSDFRKHADLFLNQLIVPAVEEFGLSVVRADQIGDAGVITSQIIEYLLKAKLCIADMSHHNPNAFYEMAIRHMTCKPIVQIIQKSDRIPFDVNQIRTVVIDNTDLYSFVPHIDSYRSEISTQVRSAINEDDTVQNPIALFYPNFRSEMLRS